MEVLFGILIVVITILLVLVLDKSGQHKDISQEQFDREYGELEREIFKAQQELNELLVSLSAAKNSYEEYLAIISDLAAKEKTIINHNKTRDTRSFDRLNFSAQEKMDLALLKEVKDKVYNKEALAKAMYDVYYKRGIKEIGSHLTNGRTISGVYKIVNNITGRVYVGHSVDVAARIETHAKRGVGSIAPTNDVMYKDMWEYGVENFSFFLLEEVSDDVQRRVREKFWIEYYGGMDYGYNSRLG